MSATTTTFARSVATLVRLSPRGSTTGPVSAAAATFAAPATPNTRPVLAALPVVWSTNQGIATSARALPVMEMALAERSAAMGDRRARLVRLRSSTITAAYQPATRPALRGLCTEPPRK